MNMRRSIVDEHGFTLSETMVVVGIVGILAAIAGVSYMVFGNTAKTVEGETALVEVNRLEMLYYGVRGQYSSDLQAIGYVPVPPLKYYAVEVRVAPAAPGVGYRATAKPTGNPQLEPWVLTRYENGTTVLEKVSPVTVGSASGGGSSDSSGSAGGSTGSAGTGAAGSGPTSKGPGTVIQTVNDPSSTGGSVGSGGNQGTNAGSTNTSGGR